MTNVIGFDYGARRIGIAIGVLDMQTANPLTTVIVPPSGIPWDEISSILDEWKPSKLIVGTVSHSTQNDNAIQKQVKTSDIDKASAAIILDSWYANKDLNKNE